MKIWKANRQLREDRQQMSSQFKTSNDGVKRAINLIPSSVVISFSNFNFSCAHLSMASSIVWSLINRITVTSLNKIKYSVLQILVYSMNWLGLCHKCFPFQRHNLTIRLKRKKSVASRYPIKPFFNGYGVKCHFEQYLTTFQLYHAGVRYRSTRRKPPTCRIINWEMLS